MVGKGTCSAYCDGPLPPTPSDLVQAEAGSNFETRVGRKGSLAHPDREKIETGAMQHNMRRRKALWVLMDTCKLSSLYERYFEYAELLA